MGRGVREGSLEEVRRELWGEKWKLQAGEEDCLRPWAGETETDWLRALGVITHENIWDRGVR